MLRRGMLSVQGHLESKITSPVEIDALEDQPRLPYHKESLRENFPGGEYGMFAVRW